MSNKIVIAKAGYNAETETDPNNLIFSSDYNTLKYSTTGSTAVHIPANGSPFETDYTIATHSVGYYPFFTAFTNLSSGSGTYYSNLPYGFAEMGVYFYVFIYTTTTQLILHVSSSGTFVDEDFTVYYKIFKNNLNL